MNNHKFLNEIEKTLFNGKLTERQRQGINYKLKAFDKHDIIDYRWRAYMLATSFHETARTMQPIEEKGRGAGKRYGKTIKYNGEVYAYPDKLYYGRGDVQLTWYENYELMGRLLNIPLLEQPELALNPEVSARIMIEGMTRGLSKSGDFTGVSLENYFNLYREDPYNARKVINGLDCAMLIEEYYNKFLTAIKNSRLLLFYFMINIMFVLVGCKPKQLINEHIAVKKNRTEFFEGSDSLQVGESKISTFNSELNRFIVDNLSYVSEMVMREIYYDTKAQKDTMSGLHPIMREIITTNIISVDKDKRDSLVLIRSDTADKNSSISLNRDISLNIEESIDENRLVKTESVHKENIWLIIVMLAILLIILSTTRSKFQL